jgi:N-carbamoyl-L-amino-acid hydrolase
MQTHDVDSRRAVDELKELAELSGGPDGARRVAWTDEWVRARDWLTGKLEEIDGVEVERDEAGNLWATAPGDSEKAVLLGGHIDSVPNGGWLDGALNTIAALEVMRVLAPQKRPFTLRLVDWADEEGARFGRSLLGSSATADILDPDEVRDLKDRDGVALPDALREHGVELDRMNESHGQLENAAAYLELHIEQGPVLERMDYPLGVVLGTFGVERHAVRFTGQHAHSGSTPMDVRRDAFIAAARAAIEFRDDAARRDDVRATTGFVNVSPAIVTAFNGWCEMSLDQRALDADRARRHAPGSQGELSAARGGGGMRGRVGEALAHRAYPLRRRAHRARGGGGERGRWEVAPAAERAAARRGVHGAPHADGHALRQEP